MLSAGVVELSSEQKVAIAYCLLKIENGEHVVALSGPAGSGKTTLIKELVAAFGEETSVTIAAMTNKAAYVLRTKGIEDAVTMHQACMKPVFRPPMDKLGLFLDQIELDDPFYPYSLCQEFSRKALSSALDTCRKRGVYAAFRELGITDIFKYIERWEAREGAEGVLIIDEASMLSEDDLKLAKEVFKSIILVGDENQLPPVKGVPVFWTIQNRISLTEIHRQAAGSQPLILATKVRTGQTMRPDSIEAIRHDRGPVIVWKNKNREKLTEILREQLGYDKLPPQVGEVLICRNTQDKVAKARGLLNNSMWAVKEAEGFMLTLENDQGELVKKVLVHMEELDAGFGVLFRFAYSLTAHSAQGSQWPEVQIYWNDAIQYCSAFPKDAKAWLYTSLTRAAERVRFVA